MSIIQWFIDMLPGFSIIGLIAAAAVWDHKTTKKQDRARQEATE